MGLNRSPRGLRNRGSAVRIGGRRERGGGAGAGRAKSRAHGLFHTQPGRRGKAQARRDVARRHFHHFTRLAQRELDLAIEHINAVDRLVERQKGGVAGDVLDKQPQVIHLRAGEGKDRGVALQEALGDLLRLLCGRSAERPALAQKQLGHTEAVGRDASPEVRRDLRRQERLDAGSSPLQQRLGLRLLAAVRFFRGRHVAEIEIGEQVFPGKHQPAGPTRARPR